MRALKKLVAAHQGDLKDHPLFELIEESRSPDAIARLARALAWWPMVIQDVLRMNVERLQGSGLEHFAEHNQDESSGHDQWFLDDLRMLDQTPPDLEDLFAAEFQPLREACYSLVSEIFRSQSAVQHVALVMALEPAGQVFFERISSALERLCPELPLRYFARSHVATEKEHDFVAESNMAELQKLALSDEERVHCIEMVARLYHTMSDVFSYLALRMQEGARSTSHVRALGSAGVIAPPVQRAGGT